MMQHHKYSLSELENMIPWERDIYISMLISFIEEENQKIKERQIKKKLKVTPFEKKNFPFEGGREKE